MKSSSNLPPFLDEDVRVTNEGAICRWLLENNMFIVLCAKKMLRFLLENLQRSFQFEIWRKHVGLLDIGEKKTKSRLRKCPCNYCATAIKFSAKESNI